MSRGARGRSAPIFGFLPTQVQLLEHMVLFLVFTVPMLPYLTLLHLEGWLRRWIQARGRLNSACLRGRLPRPFAISVAADGVPVASKVVKRGHGQAMRAGEDGYAGRSCA